MLLYIMLYVVFAYLMLCIVLAYILLLAALSNAACLHNASFLPMIYANAFYFHVLSWFIDTLFVYFMYEFASCKVLLISWFFLILCSHHCCFSLIIERAMCSPEK